MANVKRDERTKRVLHTMIDRSIYNAANGVRVMNELSWQHAIEEALTGWMKSPAKKDGTK